MTRVTNAISIELESCGQARNVQVTLDKGVPGAISAESPQNLCPVAMVISCESAQYAGDIQLAKKALIAVTELLQLPAEFRVDTMDYNAQGKAIGSQLRSKIACTPQRATDNMTQFRRGRRPQQNNVFGPVSQEFPFVKVRVKIKKPPMKYTEDVLGVLH